ncbi:MAG: PspA/IM30 family protein [Spirochaetaceae bacterium]|jgi:phage shock protein A|nr:PspA/IM30 family protein [Spirochaetaceae bacterium]
MGFFSRLKMIFSSHINSALDKAEDPEKMLNQAILDMNTQLVESKKAVALAIADEKKLEREMNVYLARSQEWERKAILAVKSGEDDLAKEALLRKQEADNAGFQYKKQWEAQRDSVQKLKESLKELQRKIEEAQRNKNLLIARAKRAEAQEKIQQTMTSVSNNKSAFEAFDRMSQKIDTMEARLDAEKELDALSEDMDVEKKFAALEKNNTSADMLLEDLKSKMKMLPQGSAGVTSEETPE